MADIEYFFDPVCPFAWQTSRWMRNVARQRDLDVEWRFICLRIINKDVDYEKDFPPSYEAAHSLGRSLLRVAAAVREQHGSEHVGPLYEAFGNELWYRTPENPDFDGVMSALAEGFDVAEILNGIGLPRELAAEMDNEKWDELLEAESAEALSRTGKDVGTPIVSFNRVGGNSYFGPVISTIPDDETSVKIFDAIETLAGFDTFSELKRSDRPALDLPLLNGAQ